MSSISLYIPIISTSYSEEDIKQLFSYHVGKVTRVDFAPAKKRPGQGENVPIIIRSAYVYISCFYRTKLADTIQRNVFGSKRGFRLTVAPREYWVLLKNHNPIPSCDQNIHQLADRLRAVESLVISQQSVISSQQLQIDSLKKVYIDQLNYNERLLDTIVELLKDSSDGPFPDMANVYEHYNYIRFNKRYNKRWLVTNTDDGDTINKSRRNDAEIDDDYSESSENVIPTRSSENEGLSHILGSEADENDDFDSSTINSELIDGLDCSENSYSNFRSVSEDTIPEETKTYIKEHVRPELFGRTVEEEYRQNYA
jgi:hypothetical protein